MTFAQLLDELRHWLDDPHNISPDAQVQINGKPIQRINYRNEADAIELYSDAS